jgi:NADH:ubiquinone oxidoreductase subunit 6 (subunit J)
MDFAILYSALAIAGALYSINARQLMRGVLGLALFFIGIAALFASMGAWFLAAGQLILFVGGVVTLFVLAFNFTRVPLLQSRGVVALVLALVAVLVGLSFLPAVELHGAQPTLQELALVFFTRYGWVLNIALLLLLSALMAAQYLMEEPR